MKTLADVMPREFFTEFKDTRAYKLRDRKVIAEHDSRVTPWPGDHRFVCFWWELEGDYLVGWNENPARGWSFPVMRKGGAK